MEQDIKIIPLKNKVLATHIEQGIRKTASGIIIPDDDGKDHGIRPRWCQVYAVGSEIKDLKIGDWILVSHGRWTRGYDITENDQKITIRGIDYPDAILLVTDTDPRLEQL